MCLEVQSLTSGSSNRSHDVGGAKQRIFIRHRGQSGSADGVGSLAEIDVVDSSVPDGLRVGGLDGLLNAGEDGGLDQELGTDASVDSGGRCLRVLATERDVLVILMIL